MRSEVRAHPDPDPLMDDERKRHQRKDRMLVLSRKKNEAILIDGVIRVEVVTVTKAAVRVRLVAPRSPHQPQGVARGTVPGCDETIERAGPVGVEVSHLTLVNQQTVTLGESISLGVVDADRLRALFVVDAPAGTSVTALKSQDPLPRRRSPGRTCSSSWGSRREGLPRIKTRSTRRPGQGTARRRAESPIRSSSHFHRRRPGASGCEEDPRRPFARLPLDPQTWSTLTLLTSRSLRAWCQIRSMIPLGSSTPVT